jgi:hypothetical protein
MKIVFACIILLFIWGIYFLVQRPVAQVEPFADGKCPTTLIKDGNQYFMYDPSMAKVPGVNPIQFKNLDEYKEYIEWQRRSNLKCPVLHLEKIYNAQGGEMYEIRQSFLQQEECGLQPQRISSVYVPKDSNNFGDSVPDAFSLALT